MAKSFPILCEPMVCSPPGSSVHGILQARYWRGLPFPSPRHSCMLSHFSFVCATPWTAAHQALLSRGFSRQEHWSGLPLPSPALRLGLRGITVTQREKKYSRGVNRLKEIFRNEKLRSLISRRFSDGLSMSKTFFFLTKVIIDT